MVVASSDFAVRIVTLPGGIFYRDGIGSAMASCDVLVCLIDAQRPQIETWRHYYTEQEAVIQLSPRIYQINKIDLEGSAAARAALPATGWTEEMPVFETNAFAGQGVTELLAGVRALLDAVGPGEAMSRRVKAAFPDRAADVLFSLERRWLGWGIRGLLRCPTACDRRSIVRIGPSDHVEARAYEPPRPAGSKLSVPPRGRASLSRDTVLAELARTLPPGDLESVERNCARDVEERSTACPWCRAPWRIAASFDGASWTIAHRA